MDKVKTKCHRLKEEARARLTGAGGWGREAQMQPRSTDGAGETRVGIGEGSPRAEAVEGW